MTEFRKEVVDRIAKNNANAELQAAAQNFMLASTEPKYSYNFAWQ